MRISHHTERVGRAFHPTYPSAPGQATTYVDCRNLVVDALTGRRQLMDTALRQLAASANILTEMAILLEETLRAGHKVLVVGNGGSAAEAQHFVAELVGRFKRERSPYAAIALTADSAILTAVANDYGYQDVFARQVRALGLPGDLLLAFSTSGESENVVQAAYASQHCQMGIIAVTGSAPSRLADLADLAVRVPGIDTAMAQELHMLITHILCDIVEQRLALSENMTKTEGDQELLSMVAEDES